MSDSLVRIARVAGLVEEPFISDRDQMLGVDGFDVRGYFGNPVCNGGGGTGATARAERKNKFSIERSCLVVR